MNRNLIIALLTGIVGAPAIGNAAIVNIDASQTGCDYSHCSGEHVSPGTVIDYTISPAKLTLAAGSYTVTNGSGLAGANPNFTAWNYNSGGANWLWSFMAIADDTNTVLLDSLPNPNITVVTTQAAAAAEPAAVNYSGAFTLAHQTTVDFVTEDYYPYDNLGGVTLNVQPAGGVPEPTTWALMLLGFIGLGSTLRRTRRQKAFAVA